MLHYILQTIAFQLFFLIIYDAFLKRETFFNCNRAYLLITSILSIVLPFIKIQSFKDLMPNEYMVNLPLVIIGKLTPLEKVSSIEMNSSETSSPLFTWENLFLLGACLALLLFILKLYKISKLIYKNPKYWNNNLRIVILLKSNIAFSFLYYVFLGEKIKEQDKPAILKHESIHVNQKHTLDLLLFEVLRILFWFNPLIYIYQNRIASLHEFIADAEAVKSQNKAEYYQDLLSQIFETENVSFINTFYKKSLIKKRIVMLGKVKSKQIQLLKYTLLIPMVIGMLVYTSSYAQDIQIRETLQSIEINQEFTDRELNDKDYVEMIELDSNGKKGLIFKNSENFSNRYLNTREEYYRFQAKMKVIFDEMGYYNGDKNVLKEKLNRSYLDYLEFKKTDEAKEIWENNTSDGVLRMVVNNLGKYEDEEQKKYDELNQLMTNDNYFHTLIVSDGFSSLKVEDLELLREKNANESIIKETIQDSAEVAFSLIDEVPTSPSCKDLANNDERRSCIAREISKHVLENFNVKLAEKLGLVGRQRISVLFKINKKGEVVEVRSRAPHPDLEIEAVRVINILPQFTPGKHKGEPVIVPYSLPIIFEVKEDNNMSNVDGIAFDNVDKAPTTKECETLSNNEEQRKCVSDMVSLFVQKNFDSDLPSKLGLKGKQRIVVSFEINKIGDIEITKASAPHPDLEAEAIRTIKLLPRFIPGEQKGQKVNVAYVLPIIFMVK